MFCFKFGSVRSIGYNFYSIFSLVISFRNQHFLPKTPFFLLEVSRELPQRSTFWTRHSLLVFFRCCFAQFPALGWQPSQHTFLYQVIFNPVSYSIFPCHIPTYFSILFCSNPAATKRVSFLDPLVSSPSSLALPQMVPEPFSYPARRFLHARDQQRLHSLHRHGTCPVNGHCPRG